MIYLSGQKMKSDRNHIQRIPRSCQKYPWNIRRDMKTIREIIDHQFYQYELIMISKTVYLHIRNILKYKCLIELWVQIFSMYFGFKFWFFIRKKVDFDKRICKTSWPISRRQIACFENLRIEYRFIIIGTYSMHLFPYKV